MNLSGLIKANNLQNSTAAEIVAALNEPTEYRTHASEVGYRGITLKYGPTFAATVLGKLKAAAASNPLLDATYIAICASGIDFSADVTQGMIDQLQAANVFTSDEASKLKSIGIWQISKAEANNLGTITEDQATAALAEIVEEQAVNVHSQLVAYVHNEVFNANRYATMAELKATVAAIEE